MFIAPMLAHKAEKPFDDPAYLAEPKMDGFRLILSTVFGIHAYTRHQKEVTDRFPELHEVVWCVVLLNVLEKVLILDSQNCRP
ncbi:hypothetical protein [Planifilum fimeticola]|nr:hypothetical protein [Planifilum fimeticola]